MDISVWINVATMLSGFIVAAGGLFLTKRKNVEDSMTSLHNSANIDRTWLREEVTRLREEVTRLRGETNELRLEAVRLRALCRQHNIDPDKEHPQT